MKKTKTIAISMITLVIMIPIYSAMVFGDWDIISIGGNDGAHKGTTGYMGEDDTLVVKLNSDYGDVRCSCNPNTPLECTPKDTGYECSFYDDTGAEAGKYDFSFYRFDGSRPIGNSIPASVIVDNEKPTITFDAVFNGNISVSFTAKDTALEGGCSGIKTVKFFINGREWKTYDKSSLVGACEFSGSAEYVPPTSDGLKKMHAIAFDYVGNYQRSDFVELYVDTTHPKISSVYLKRGNARLDYISNKPLSGTKVVILFEEHDLSNDGVVADLSRLTLNP
ncbi:hypothetical protein GOV08_00555, partial [Candidatus Woesearchaeota archaeon]|nr:hypothetical protein [Candidatus Woesearchaeota archaeon]